VFCWLLVVLASVAFAEEPIKFRGAYVGEPLSDFVDCSSGKGKLLKEGYKSHGKLCEGKKGVIWRTKIRGFLNTKEDGDAFMFEGSKLFRIMIFIPNEDWEKVRYDITDKMGAPASEVPQTFQNGFGARWEYNQGFWSKGDTVVFAGIKVDSVAGQAITSPFSNQPSTRGIEVTITDAEHAKLPSTTANSMD
jgi:hypothetical protein